MQKKEKKKDPFLPQPHGAGPDQEKSPDRDPALKSVLPDSDRGKKPSTSVKSRDNAEDLSISSYTPDSCLSLLNTQITTISSNDPDFPPLSSTVKSNASVSDSDMDLSEVVPLRNRDNTQKN